MNLQVIQQIRLPREGGASWETNTHYENTVASLMQRIIKSAPDGLPSSCIRNKVPLSVGLKRNQAQPEIMWQYITWKNQRLATYLLQRSLETGAGQLCEPGQLWDWTVPGTDLLLAFPDWKKNYLRGRRYLANEKILTGKM